MKNILTEQNRLFNFVVPHNSTFYAVCDNNIKDYGRGAGNCVELCGNSHLPRPLFYTFKSYHE